MSVSLLPGIVELAPDSLCYSIYTQLYQKFFNAQTSGTIIEGDDTSIRLRNAAFGFAEAIAGGVSGEGGSSGGALAAYLKRSGGEMSGFLSADYGFAAGAGNTRVLETFKEGDAAGVQISGQLRIDSDGFYMGGRRILRYLQETDTTDITCSTLSLGSTHLKTLSDILVGNAGKGVWIAPDQIQIAGQNVFHSGNANLASIDWAMKNATVAGVLSVAGEVLLRGYLTALQGVSFGYGNQTLLQIKEGEVTLNSNLILQGMNGIFVRKKPVLTSINEETVALNAPGGEVLLGQMNTTAFRLLAPIKDSIGTRTLISAAGDAFFPSSLRVAHNLGPDLLTTYYANLTDTGVIFHRYLRLGGANGPGFTHNAGNLIFTSAVARMVDEKEHLTWHELSIGHEVSRCPQAKDDSFSDDLFIRSDAKYIHFGNALYAEDFIGVQESHTRLGKECLFFTDAHRLHSVAGGIKHFGQALFVDGLASETFSSGMAGSGWAITRNATTGATTATFDDLIIRRRLRIYELEVQRARASNGSFWISDSCSADSVEKL